MTPAKRKILLARMAVAVLCLAAAATVISIIHAEAPGKPIGQLVPPPAPAAGGAVAGASTVFTFQASNGDLVSLAIDPAQALLASAPARLSWSLNLANQSRGKIVFVYHSTLPPAWPAATLPFAADALPFAPPDAPPVQWDVYQLTMEHGVQADTSAAVLVPEPGSLALIGLGLLGMSLIPGMRAR